VEHPGAARRFHRGLRRTLRRPARVPRQPALEKLFRSRAERQIGYKLKKELRALAGDIIANYWEGEWKDAVTGKDMTGRGVEVWVLREGKIAVWEAAFNTYDEHSTMF